MAPSKSENTKLIYWVLAGGLLLFSMQAYIILTSFFDTFGGSRSRSIQSTIRNLFQNADLVGEVGFWLSLVILINILVVFVGLVLYRYGVPRKAKRLSIMPWVFGLFWLLFPIFENAFAYPDSIQSDFLYSVRELPQTRLFRHFLQVFFLTAVIAALMRLFLALRPSIRAASLLVATIVTALFALGAGTPENRAINTAAKPNIIVLSVDSLRTEFIDGSERATHVAPFLNSALERSEVADKAYTIMARTYPAWLAALSGQSPHVTQVRFNLTPESTHPPLSLVTHALKQYGYITMYGTDETRFSNLRDIHGFDYHFGPRQGGLDFLLGSLGDFLVVNHLVNTRLGEYLFPYQHGNRSLSKIYEPETFSALAKRHIRRLMDSAAKSNQPIFLAVHFCLPHWPYRFAHSADYRGQKYEHDFTRYELALHQTDLQMAEVFQELEQSGALDNTLLIYMSDHGETLYGESPITHEIHPTRTLVRQTAGHGTTVISESQYEILLALESRSPSVSIPEDIPLASILDIAPTVAAAAGIDLFGTEGINLLDPGRGSGNRILLRETGLTPNAMNFEDISEADAVSAAIDFYDLTEQGHLRVKPHLLPDLKESKERSIQLDRQLFTAHRMIDRERWYLSVIDLDNRSFREFCPGEARADDWELYSTFCRVWRDDPQFPYSQVCAIPPQRCIGEPDIQLGTS